MSETASTTDTLERLAEQLDQLARSATDWRHTDKLVDGLQHVLRSLDLLERWDASDAAAHRIRPPLPCPVAGRIGWYDNAPDGAPRLDSDVDWDSDFVQIQEPEHVRLLADWGPSAAGGGAVGPLAITAPFRILGDAGLRHFQAIAGELDASAADVDSRRVPRHSRGAIYRSSFLQGLHTDPTILDFLSSLAGIRIEPHPNGHHASHFNFAPTDISKAVDSWHTDVTAFDAVMHVFDIDGMTGGGFEYFDGPAEEGRDLLATTGQLPTDRVIRPEFPGAGWMVFQQGNRVLHRAAPLLEPWRRCTYVPSFIAHHPAIEDPDVLGTLVTIDGPIAAPVEYARHRCHVAARRLREAAGLADERVRRDALRVRRSDLGTVLEGLLDPTPAPFVDYG